MCTVHIYYMSMYMICVQISHLLHSSGSLPPTIKETQSCMFLPNILLYIISELQVCVAVVGQVCMSVVL
jgi:hypothetical protein